MTKTRRNTKNTR
jgi:multidrug efflux pump subunit AcrA (membrane-fusion protein)